MALGTGAPWVKDEPGSCIGRSGELMVMELVGWIRRELSDRSGKSKVVRGELETSDRGPVHSVKLYLGRNFSCILLEVEDMKPEWDTFTAPILVVAAVIGTCRGGNQRTHIWA